MTNYQKSMIEKSAELRDIADELQANLQKSYVIDRKVQAQDVVRIERLYQKALMLSEAAGRAEG